MNKHAFSFVRISPPSKALWLEFHESSLSRVFHSFTVSNVATNWQLMVSEKLEDMTMHEYAGKGNVTIYQVIRRIQEKLSMAANRSI